MKKNIEKLFLLIATLFSVSVIAQGYDEAINPSNPNGQEGEAHIIMNPLDSNKLVVGYMDSGSPLGFKIFRSTDGGNTWEASQFNPASAMQSTYPGYLSAGGGDIVFAYDKQGNLYCEILNVSGQVVWQENYTIESGLNQLQLKTNGLSKGNYILKLSNNIGHFIIRTFVKH